jgi:hypothetical protein
MRKSRWQPSADSPYGTPQPPRRRRATGCLGLGCLVVVVIVVIVVVLAFVGGSKTVIHTSDGGAGAVPVARLAAPATGHSPTR